MKELFTDPRPDLPDSALWTSLFRKMALMPDLKRTMPLHLKLYELRRFGAGIKKSYHETKLVPGEIEQSEYDEVKEHLLPYKAELKDLLGRL